MREPYVELQQGRMPLILTALAWWRCWRAPAYERQMLLPALANRETQAAVQLASRLVQRQRQSTRRSFLHRRQHANACPDHPLSDSSLGGWQTTPQAGPWPSLSCEMELEALRLSWIPNLNMMEVVIVRVAGGKRAVSRGSSELNNSLSVSRTLLVWSAAGHWARRCGCATPPALVRPQVIYLAKLFWRVRSAERTTPPSMRS